MPALTADQLQYKLREEYDQATPQQRQGWTVTTALPPVVLHEAGWRDKEGRDWQVGKDLRGEWVRLRRWRYPTTTRHEHIEPHELRLARWPIPDATWYAGGIPLTKPGEVSVQCELCGGHFLVSAQMVKDADPAYKFILPDAKKGAA